jgi:hypothetical protein
MIRMRWGLLTVNLTAILMALTMIALFAHIR